MMRVKARSSPRCAFRRTPRSGWVSDTARRSIALIQEILPLHLFGFRNTEEGECSRRKIGQLAVSGLRRGVGGDERHPVRRVRGLRTHTDAAAEARDGE